MRHVATLLLAVTVVGCASMPATTAISPEEVKMLAGSWQGWLVTERGFNLINFEIRADGTFEISGRSVQGNGVLVVTDGGLRFDGTGPWRGTLVPQGTGEPRALRLERDDRLYRGTLHQISNPG